MAHRRSLVVVLCFSLLALGGRASADLIIDEHFDVNCLVDSGGSTVPVNAMMAMMWLRDMSAPFGMWMYMTDPSSGMAFVMGGMAMGMSTEPWWRTLTYFMGAPQTGMAFPGNMLNFSFMYMAMVPMGGVAYFGVWGWQEGDEICIGGGSPDPCDDGTLLMSGQLAGNIFIDAFGGATAQEDGWTLREESYTGDLSQFPFIGVTFTFGVAVGDGSAPQVLIDDVKLETNGTIPEPATTGLLVIGLAAAAYARRRRRTSARATRPPG